jgi:bifunctional non-homologous end joining protein LigD
MTSLTGLNTHMKPESTALFFQKGTSDKVYNVKLIAEKNPMDDPYEQDAIWYVCFQYGRRGSSLVNGRKNQQGLTYWAAKRMYQTLVRSKLRKGYKPKTDGSFTTYTPYEDVYAAVAADEDKMTDFVPQLLTPVDLAGAKALWKEHAGNILLQTKHDGERRNVVVQEKLVAANRKGREVQIQQSVSDACKNLIEGWDDILEIDTEDMGSHLVIFDCLQIAGEDMRKKSFLQRNAILQTLHMSISQARLEHLLKVDVAYKPDNYEEFIDFINYARETNEEGVVISIGSQDYGTGLSQQKFKLKFYADATVEVTAINEQRSVRIAVNAYRKGSRDLMVFEVGNCAIPANREIPEIGDLVEVRYLYAYPGGSLYQPFYKGLRTDKDEPDNADSLQYKK